LKILFADDQREIRELTTLQLERHGHRVTCVCDGPAALEAFEAPGFDIVLLDEQMPGLTGVAVARRIRELDASRNQKTLLVAITGNNTDDDCRRLLAAGFDAVIGKPFRLEALTALVGDHTAQHSGANENTASATSTPITTLERVGGDEKLLRKLIRTFLLDSPKRMVALKKALASKNVETLVSTSHALKGSISIFSAEAASNAARDLQQSAKEGNFTAAARHFATLKEEIAKLQENLRRYAKQPKVKPRTKGK
jgi:CheY-like chemotaxis protein